VSFALLSFGSHSRFWHRARLCASCILFSGENRECRDPFLEAEFFFASLALLSFLRAPAGAVKKVRSLLLFRLSQFKNKKGSMPAFLHGNTAFCSQIHLYFCRFLGCFRGTPAFPA